jgi:hypothetical protein
MNVYQTTASGGCEGRWEKDMSEAKLQAGGKAAIITALIGVAGTVIVAWIGIIPTLRQTDKDEIDKLKAEIVQLKNTNKSEIESYKTQVSGLKTALSEAGERSKTWLITGSVQKLVDGQTEPARNATLDLSSIVAHHRTTDDQGEFVFPNVQHGFYNLIISIDPNARFDSRAMIEARGPLRDDKQLENDDKVIIGVKYEVKSEQ